MVSNKIAVYGTTPTLGSMKHDGHLSSWQCHDQAGIQGWLFRFTISGWTSSFAKKTQKFMIPTDILYSRVGNAGDVINDFDVANSMSIYYAVFIARILSLRAGSKVLKLGLRLRARCNWLLMETFFNF